ncbi:haloacid dehalogenase [Pacificimonas flava]|uniref:Haloacid dehalogenase n=2 Tax=Pacificimonas TaxID=1960290 RepID=A0A219B6T2_9SPHN|nr:MULTISPECIES: HAD-IA family hydrolase [Pacificimonas]MBZ6378895.1 HAD-IA family hydrolase [Pacificimonas aurantium]OWV33853.1 haloacid dehalogenase [Pacificimonas flava]
MTVRLAIFDCDGTLMDSQANIIAAMDACFDMNSLPPPPAHSTRRVVGLSLPEAMAMLLPEAETDFHGKLAEDYKTCFKRMRADETLAHEPLYEGTLDALDALEAKGWLLGIATGKSDRGLDHALEFHGIRDRFVTLQTADRHASKPHPSMLDQAMRDAGAMPEDSVMIGDTVFDMEMARNARVRALGVAWGYHGPEELTDAGAETVLDDYPELTAYLTRHD